MDKPPFKRVNYFQGQVLTEQDLLDEQEYHNSKRHLLNRCLHGSGVIYGLEVSINENFLTIETGLALDCRGREIYVPEKQIGIKPLNEKDLYLLIEYHEYESDPIPSIGDGATVNHTRITESFRLSWGSGNPMARHEPHDRRWKSCGECHPALLAKLCYRRGQLAMEEA